MSPEDTFRKSLISAFAAACLFVWTAGAFAMEAESFSVHLPVPITAEADPVLSFSVSRNGMQLAFVSNRKRFSDLWLRSLDPAAFFSIRRLTDDPALESDPAFSEDGRFLAFVSTRHDAKGDIYVIDLRQKTPAAIRITGKETEDGAPCFGPGDTLYFHRKQPELRVHELAAVNIGPFLRGEKEKQEPEILPTQGDAAFPSVSPDGLEIAFISNRDSGVSHIHVLNLKTGTLRQATRESFPAFFPRWSLEGESILFSSRPWDTNKDGIVDERDNAVLYRVFADGKGPYPLTSAGVSATRPVPSEKGLFFLSDANGVSNCGRIPSEGQIPHLATFRDQLALARRLEKRLPRDPHLTVLAYHKVLERYAHLPEAAAPSLYAMGEIYVEEGFPHPARRAFEMLIARYGDHDPEALLARIQQCLLETNEALGKTNRPEIRRRIVEDAHARLNALAQGREPDIRHRVRIHTARLLVRIKDSGSGLLQAIRLLDDVITDPNARPERIAEAMVRKGNIFQKIGNLDAVYPVYLAVLQRYPDVPVWADAALEAMLDVILTQKGAGGMEARIQLLRSLSDQYRAETPKLAIGALNRVGDIYYAADEWSRAKAAYRQVIDQFPVVATQTAAARFALAEILYQEQRFRDALALYENEIHLRKEEDRIRNLAKQGFIHKSVEGAEYYFELGEIDAARSLFKEILDFDDRVVEAHRGYIKCAAAQSDLDRVLTAYRKQAADHPSDPVAVYALGLSLTYREDKKSLMEARTFLERAILLNGRVSHFHRTLGYVMEVLETVHGEKNGLEAALEAYQKAYFLTDPETDPKSLAELGLNLGNVHYLLGQYAKAFHYYEKRLAVEKPFTNIKAALLFYKRFGTAAFQVREVEETLGAFNEAIRRIDSGIDAQDPSAYLNRNHRYIMDRIVAPALLVQSMEKRAAALAETQVDATRALADPRIRREPPPGPAWEAYREMIQQVIHAQKRLNRDALSLAEAGVKAGIHPKNELKTMENTLSSMLSKAREAIRLPEQLVQLKTEMLDRLGLARQDAGQYPEAVNAFEQAYSLNQGLENFKNLARNLRSVAFNRYLAAESRSGASRREMLRQALEEFTRVITLVDQYGVPDPTAESTDALIRIDVRAALDAPGATRSGKGFSALQEKRLAEAFISRITVELGEIETSAKAVDRQLRFYAGEKSVSDADAYGVALLYHRSGHLAAARGDWSKAWDHFQRSAELAVAADIPVGAMMNLMNLGKAMNRMPLEGPEQAQRLGILETLNRRILALLSRNSAPVPPEMLAGYHNAMGVYFPSTPGRSGEDLPEVVLQSRRMHQAHTHFLQGIQLLETPDAPVRERKTAALLAALYLNMGRAGRASEMDPETVRTHFQKALALSERHLLPHMAWRALLALGRSEAALRVLESTSVLQAGCHRGEILDGFFNTVTGLFENKGAETAFNFLEKIAEMERFHRLAPLMIRLSGPEKALFIQILSHLDRIDRLTERLAGAESFLKQELESDLALEEKRLADRSGKDDRNLPDVIRLISDDAARMSALRLLGLAALAESTADEAVRNPEDTALRRRYRETMDRYTTLLKRLENRRLSNTPFDIFALFGPGVYEAVDVMETLPEKNRFVRIYKTAGAPGPVITFTLTPDRISGRHHDSLETALGDLSSSETAVDYLAVDYPEDISASGSDVFPDANFVFNAAHFMRSMHHKKLFKRRVLRISSLSSADPLEALDEKTYPGFHVLVVDTPVLLARHVPTRPGAFSFPFAAVELEKGRRLSLLPLLNRLDHASCAVLTETAMEDAYWIGHLFSIYGCPTLILPFRPAPDDPFPGAFLDAFETHTARQALNLAESKTRSAGKRILIGFPGMTPEESRIFARTHFESHVKRAKQAFDRKAFGDARILFENALEIAAESDAFHDYLPALYAFARESAFLSGDRRAALEFARHLVDFLETRRSDSPDHADALLRLGLIQAHLEMFPAAAETMAAALEIYQALELSPEQAETLSEMAWVAEQSTEYERALTYFESSVSLAKDSDPRWRLGDRFRSIGRIYDLRLSQYATAITNYRKAAELYRQGKQTPESRARTAQALLDIGRCYRLLGNLSEAETYYEESMTLVSPLPEEDALRTKIIIEQANNAWYRARYEAAFRLKQEAWNLAVEKDLPLMQVVTLNTSGLLWWALGDNEKALNDLRRALESAKKLPHRRDEVATTWNNIGMILRETGRFQEALDAFENALAIDTRLKSRWALAYDYRHIGVTRLKMGRIQDALPLLNRALQEARAIGNRIHEAKALLDLADARFTVRELSEAGRLYEEALALSRRLAVREVEWRALYGLARVKETTQPDDAIRLLKDAMDIIESIRSNIRIIRLKDGFLSNKMMVYETLCRLLADSGNPVEAFETAERSRSRNFIDLLGSQSLSLDPAVDRRLYDRYHGLKERIESLKQQAAQETDEKERERHETLLKKATSALETVMLEIQAANPALSSLVAVEPVRAPDLQALIEPGTALLSYYLLEDELFCWRILPDDIRLYRIQANRKDLGEAILEFRRRIQNLEPFEAPSKHLFDTLLAPVLSGLNGIKQLGVIPHGHLHYLSFAALFDGTDFVIDRFPLFYLPSASVLKYTVEKRVAEKNPDVLAIGNPDLGNPALDLPFSEYEVNSIQWNFPEITILTKERATEKWVVDNIERFGIIHLASHGEFDPVNPLLSALRLAKEGATDGNLEAAEIFGLKLSADLVVLSACQTGLGKITTGDDVIGLNRAFLYAGTHAVISSLWRVSDISTAMLIKSFYRRYVEKNKAESLRSAALHVKNRFPHPGYWGAFTLVGDYQ